MAKIYDKIINGLELNKNNVVEIASNITVMEYLDQCALNILSDTVMTVIKSKGTIYKKCLIESQTVIKYNNLSEHITNNVILISNNYHIVKKVINYDELEYSKIHVYPDKI